MNSNIRPFSVITNSNLRPFSVVTNISKINLYRSLQIFFVMVLLAFSAEAVMAQVTPHFANFTIVNANQASFTLPDGVTGTVTKADQTCIIPEPLNAFVQSAANTPNYPGTWFSISPGTTEWLEIQNNRDGGVAGCGAATVLTQIITVTFAAPGIREPRIHFTNIDAGRYTIQTTAGAAITVTRESGNPEFDLTAPNLLNTPIAPIAAGCDDAAGGNPNGGCGTISLPGLVTAFRYLSTDSQPDPGLGDGYRINFSLFADYGDAPASYHGAAPARHEITDQALRMGALVDSDRDDKRSAGYNGDDVSGTTDDEDGVAAFQSYLVGGGMTCTGTLGTYTTLANEYCVVVNVAAAFPTGQLVGWMDTNNDGDWNDAGERSVPINHPAVDDGTFTTGNAPQGTRNYILVWTGLPSALPATTSAFRFRVTRDPLFFAAAPPVNGIVISGEVEDYRVTVATIVPTAANVSISGRILTQAGRGIMGAKVILTDMEGNALEAISNPFGYYRVDSVPSGATYIITASAKRYVFDTQVVMVKDEIAGLDIIALE